MENDFCSYTIRNFVFFIKYVESIIHSLEIQCSSINERLICLLNRVQCSQQIVLSLDSIKEFKIIENWSLCDFMKFDDKFILKNSYFNTLKDCEKLFVLVKENFPNFLKDFNSKLSKKRHFSERSVDNEMDESRVYNFNAYLRAQKKEELRKKSKNPVHSKSSKMINFRNSIGKLFRMKSQSEKSLKHEDLIVGTIPSTIYLSPNSSLPRDLKCLKNQQFVPKPKLPTNQMRHSCSDFSCRRSSTFCIYETVRDLNKSEQNLKVVKRLTNPPNSAFYPVTEEEFEDPKVHSSNSNVPHSKSVPLQLSQSQQNINQCKKSQIDIHNSAKRNPRKKSFFNCSLFRKRSNSRSKSSEKINQHKPSMLKCFDKLKHLPQLTDESSILSDRCLTLPNLKSSEVDLTSHVGKNAQLLSIDLIKDYLNRSDNAISTSVQRNSIDNSSYYQFNPQSHSSMSVQNSPLSLPNRKSINESRNFDSSKFGLYESLILENSHQNQTYEIKPTVTSAYNEVYNGNNIQTCVSANNNSALDSIIYKNSVDVNEFVKNNNRCQFTRQISAPHYYTRQTKSKLPLVQPPTGAVEFWTRPYQEKIKASRRRLLDDKVGSKEALLRSMSPQNLRIYDGESLYDNSYHLQMIPEPTNSIFMEEYDSPSNWITSSESMVQSNSFCGSISPDFHSVNFVNPVVENRLSESPIVKRQESINDLFKSNYMGPEELHNLSFSNEECSQRLSSESYNSGKSQNKVHQEMNEIQKIKSFYAQNGSNFEGSLLMCKEMKSLRSSTELILTRTPTPPHSFAESSISSVPPVPKEFLNDSSQSGTKTNHYCGNVNLLYTSDNSSDSHEDLAELDVEFSIPIPPPRTDSVLRSIQSQQNNDTDKSELEYDMVDDVVPIFSGANIDKCDIEQYHKWLDKLPYKLSEFPDILHSRKSAVTAKKTAPTEELIDIVPDRIGLLELKHLKQYRKSIKSWNMDGTELSKVDYESANLINSRTASINESSSMKKSFSCDHSLHSSDKTSSMDELDRQVKLSQNLTTTETTLLRQYSHLYSLKFSPSHNSVINSIQSASVLKSNRSKSIDLRNFISTNQTRSVLKSDKCPENRKSAPNTNIHLEK